jgi:hypothetical protein
MKRFINLKLIALFALLAVVPFVAGAYSARVAAHEGEVHAQATQAPSTQKAPAAETVYHYVAQPGDSYSLIARKAVQTYGIVSKTKLSPAQIIFAETHITQAAGSPSLSVGQKVDVKESTVKSWVEKASKLSASEKAAWNVYAQGVNFNTDNVGQAK